MRQKSAPDEVTSERIVKDISRATPKRHSAEEKIRIVLEGLRGEDSIAEQVDTSEAEGRADTLCPPQYGN